MTEPAANEPDANEPDVPESASWDPETDPDGYTYDDIRPKDWYLDTVLNFAHGSDDEGEGGMVGLTVTSGGALVSGLAISRDEWIKRTVDLYRSSGAPDTARYIEELFNKVQNITVDRAKERRDADLPTRVRGFLHMKDVQIGTGTVTTQVPLWRCSLADITGWSLGSWNPKQSPPESDLRRASLT